MSRKLLTMSLAPVVFVCLAVGAPGQMAIAAMTELSTADLVDQSDEIIEAEVLSMKSRWNDAGDFIFTDVTLQVTANLKGQLAATAMVIVTVPGGEMDGMGLGVEHAPQFELAENVILFLREIEDAVYGVTGWEQGKYTVVNGQVPQKQISREAFLDEVRAALK